MCTKNMVVFLAVCAHATLWAGLSSALAQEGGSRPGVRDHVAERAGVYVTPEERIARLEAALARANAKLVGLEAKFAHHTHSVPGWEIGLVREKINGRNIELAFHPRRTIVQSTPPTQ